MPPLTGIPPEVLLTRHGLTARQINSLSGRTVYPESAAGQIAAFEMTRELFAVSEAFSQKGIEFIPLKGPVLSHRLYGDATRRHYGDLDILVRVASVGGARLILKELGYNEDDPVWPGSDRKQRVLIRHTNEIFFTHREKSILVELHWQLLKTLPAKAARFEDIADRNLTVIDFGGRSFSVFSNELELLWLIIHGGVHWWRRLKWLVDVKTLLETQPVDWKVFAALTEEMKATRMVGLCQAVLAEYFPGGPAIEGEFHVSSFMVRFSLKRIAADDDLISDFHRRALQTLIFTLISFPGLRYKIRAIRNHLFIKEYFGKSQFLDWLPMFYFYGTVRQFLFRLKR
jgi:hypothetical protein